MKYGSTLTFSLLLALIVGYTASAQSTPKNGDFFPMSKGTYWIYRGTVEGREGSAHSDGTLYRKDVVWKVEVVEAIARDHITAAILNGHAYDLFFGADVKNGSVTIKRQDYLLIRKEDEGFYLLRKGGDNFENFFERVLKTIRDMDALPDYPYWRDRLELKLPIQVGEIIGGTPGEAGIGRNIVEGQAIVRINGIKGISPAEMWTEYIVSNSGNTGGQKWAFVPGIGITGLTGHYEFNGLTKLKTHVQLIEFHDAKRHQ